MRRRGRWANASTGLRAGSKEGTDHAGQWTETWAELAPGCFRLEGRNAQVPPNRAEMTVSVMTVSVMTWLDDLTCPRITQDGYLSRR